MYTIYYVTIYITLLYYITITVVCVLYYVTITIVYNITIICDIICVNSILSVPGKSCK